MTRRPNFAKFMLGIAVLALLFVGTWAATSARRTNPTKAARLTVNATASTRLAPLPAPAHDVGPTGVFEIEGNQLNDANVLGEDWETVNCGVPAASTAVAKVRIVDPLNATIFTGGGSKDIHDVTSWRHKSGSVPPKTEILNAYAAKYTPNIIVFGAERIKGETAGSSFVGFWLFKDDVAPIDGGTFSGAHTVGDVLVLAEFSNGGITADTKVFKWVASGGDAGAHLLDITGEGSAGAHANEGAIPTPSCYVYTPEGGSPGDPIPQNAFFEGFIDLDSFDDLEGSCFSSFIIETRSSFETNSQLKDFAGGSFDTCASVEVTKTADPGEVCSGAATEITYTYAVNNTSGQAEDVSVVDDNGTPGDTTDDFDVIAQVTIDSATGTPQTQSIPAGITEFEYVVTVTLTSDRTNIVTVVANPSGVSATDTAEATVTVNDNPTVSILAVSCSLTQPASIFLDATPSGGTGPYTSAWSTAEGTEDISVGAPGIYTVTVTDANGCVSAPASIRVGLCAGP